VDNDSNGSARFAALEDEALDSVETSQALLSALLAYIHARVNELSKETALAAVFTLHRLFADCDRKLLALRLERSFSSAAADSNEE